jgi:epoxyqueuosine reductase
MSPEVNARTPVYSANIDKLADRIRSWGEKLGFQQIGFAGIDLPGDEARLEAWLEQGRHGEMGWMRRHGRKRTRPAELVHGTVSVISARMDYLPPDSADPEAVMADGSLAFISRYALGRDYHKVLRQRLQRLADRISREIGDFGYRVFVDSAPVLEKALARDAGIGWIGKHTNLINRNAGSWFFLGEIYTDVPLPADTPAMEHCGSCRACIDICPTQAITGPWDLDARRCISYLTIELPGSIPEEFRAPMGNRIYGCDDCQIVCPWNKFATLTAEPEFRARHGLDAPDLVALFAWSEQEFLDNTAGSAIRRIGHVRWLRNLAIGLGNASTTPAVIGALESRLSHGSAIVREHVEWAIAQHANRDD